MNEQAADRGKINQFGQICQDLVVHNQEVTTADNIIIINYGEPGSGVTSGSAGIQVDRGSLADYVFLFDETSDTFEIGEVGDLQAVATREDAPVDQSIPYWNDVEKRYDTVNTKFKINVESAEIYDATSMILITIPTGIKAGVSTFDIKTSSGNDGMTISRGIGSQIALVIISEEFFITQRIFHPYKIVE